MFPTHPQPHDTRAVSCFAATGDEADTTNASITPPGT